MTQIEEQRKEIKEPPKYVRVDEVMSICECSESHAYRIINRLNKELASKGYITTAGRISRKYFLERLYI